jgi:hypothetical protein
VDVADVGLELETGGEVGRGGGRLGGGVNAQHASMVLARGRPCDGADADVR